MILGPMAEKGEEPIGSMGADTPLACLSDKPQPLFHYFKQLFAQVTNPPIDPIREEMVMSLTSYIGTERNILDETPQHCHTLKLPHPILTNRDLEKLRRVSQGDFLATTLPMLFPVEEGGKGLERALTQLCRRASLAIQSGYTLLILSDRGVDPDYAPIPSLLALAAVHNHLVREETRTQVALIIESGEPREVMHFALLIGYGASAVNPYLALETVARWAGRRAAGAAMANFIKAINKGLLKTFSKMGISTLQSYRGAQVFEAIGLDRELVEKYFTGTVSRIEGVGLDVIARGGHAASTATPSSPCAESETELAAGGNYQYRARGEYHLFNPQTIAKLQHAVRQESFATFQEYTDLIDTPEPAALHAARAARAQDVRRAGSARGSRAGAGDRQALRHRRHVVRLHFQGSARDPGHRHEPHRRPVQHRRRRGRRRALRRPAAQLRQAGGFGPLRRHRQLPGERRRVADQDGAGRQARRGRPASRPQGG